MAATESTMLELGTTAPNFSLPDLQGEVVCIDDFWKSPLLLVCFLCPHCPFVRHVRREVARVAAEYAPRGLATVGIMSNDVEKYPQDGPEGMRREAEEAGYTFPYLFDETQGRQLGREHRIVALAVQSVVNLTHRGGVGADSRTGDGAGVFGLQHRAELLALGVGDEGDVGGFRHLA